MTTGLCCCCCYRRRISLRCIVRLPALRLREESLSRDSILLNHHPLSRNKDALCDNALAAAERATLRDRGILYIFREKRDFREIFYSLRAYRLLYLVCWRELFCSLHHAKTIEEKVDVLLCNIILIMKIQENYE